MDTTTRESNSLSDRSISSSTGGLSNHYREWLAWLVQAHARLDRAVWKAYRWDELEPEAVSEDAISGRLLALNLKRGRVLTPETRTSTGA